MAPKVREFGNTVNIVDPPSLILNTSFYAFTPIASTSFTYDTWLICDSSTNSAVNIRWIAFSQAPTAQGLDNFQVTCNGLTVGNNGSLLWIGIQERPLLVFAIPYVNETRVETFVNGDAFTWNQAIVNGGLCAGSIYKDLTMYKGYPNNGCNSINGITTQTAVYRLWTLTGTCNTVCQVYELAGLGHIWESFVPGFNNNGAA